MKLNGYQLFVRSEDVKKVSAAISQYVEKNGCDAYVEIDSDVRSPTLGSRSERAFTLSTPRNGFITIWENGSWADKRLAQQLSSALATETIWLMVSDSTVSWGYIKFEGGEETERQHEETDELEAEAVEFADQHGLPFALAFLPDPDLARRFAEFHKSVEEEGILDDLDSPDDEELEAELSDDDEPEEDEEEVDVDEDEPEESTEAEEKIDEWEQDLERERAGFTELTLSCS